MKMPYAALVLAVITLAAVGLQGCPPEPRDAMAVSNGTLDFGLNEVPLLVFVWNTDPAVTSMAISASASRSWIQITPASVTSTAPGQATGPYDKKSVQVSINRSQLAIGTHEGTVTFSSNGIVSKTVVIRVQQDTETPQDDLVAQNPTVTYSDPYIVDFKFSLRDKEDRAVVAEPGEFTLTGRENGVNVDPLLSGLQVRRAASRQLKLEMLLDYSLPMAVRPGILDAMEDAAVELILPALSEDALVGVTEFHRDDFEASRVQPFTVAHTQVAERILQIRSGIALPSSPNFYDALLDAIVPFDGGDREQEARYLIALVDGRSIVTDTSANDIVAAATALGVKIYIVTFSDQGNTPVLLDITTRTGGALFSAENLEGLDSAIGRVVDDLEGQYNVRWASTRRNATPVYPSFTLELEDKFVTVTSATAFKASDYEGGGVLGGKLFFVSSDGEDRTTSFLRAAYVPRSIREMRIYLKTDVAYSASIVDVENGGLLDDWVVSATEDNGGVWLQLESVSQTALPFAAFGPMVRFDFEAVLGQGTPPFETVYVDNSQYDTTGGQSFAVDGYENILPGEGEGEGEGENPQLALSDDSLFFFSGVRTHTFDVWNAATNGSTLTFIVTTDDDNWITSISPNTGTSTGPNDRVTVTVTSNYTGTIDYGSIDVASTGGDETVDVTWAGL